MAPAAAVLEAAVQAPEVVVRVLEVAQAVVEAPEVVELEAAVQAPEVVVQPVALAAEAPVGVEVALRAGAEV